MADDFDKMTDSFGAAMRRASHWRDTYYGAAYSTRIKSAIADAKHAISQAEAHPEIGFVEPKE